MKVMKSLHNKINKKVMKENLNGFCNLAEIVVSQISISA